MADKKLWTYPCADTWHCGMLLAHCMHTNSHSHARRGAKPKVPAMERHNTSAKFGQGEVTAAGHKYMHTARDRGRLSQS